MGEPILQSQLPYVPWMDPRTSRLPGTLPIADGDWLRADDAFAGQMAERDRLTREMEPVVHALLPEGRAAADELFGRVLDHLAMVQGYTITDTSVRRPDGVLVHLDRGRPLVTLGRLVQEDLCLMEKQGDEYVLTGAILCFPASWSLDEKLGRSLIGIHHTVKPYDADIARRVQRMFDAIRPEQPLWRMNALIYRDPTLHQPGRENAPRTDRRGGQYLRAERQCLMRLPETRAIVFSIHTYVVHLDNLTPDQRAGLETARL